MNSEMPGTFVPPNYVISLEELQTSTEMKKTKERTDFAMLKTIPMLPSEELLPKLYDWASKGYPKNFVVKTLTIETPPTCSDGVSRRFIDYILFLCKDITLESIVGELSTRMPGMSFSYSFNTTTVDIHVSKQ